MATVASSLSMSTTRTRSTQPRLRSASGRLRSSLRVWTIALILGPPRSARLSRRRGAQPKSPRSGRAVISTEIGRARAALSATTIARMRRRLRSASFPLHRHSLPQLVIDGVLVALAYVLAFQLRFDRGLTPSYQSLFERTLPWAVGLSLVFYVGHRLYGKWWRYSTLRDLVSVVQAVVVSTIALAAFVSIT